MLYVTTRSNRDAYTAQKVLLENRAPDGGLFVPLHQPEFSVDDIRNLSQCSFSKGMTIVLNKLFHTHLTARDIELAVGRYPVRLKKLNQRLLISECWHNLDSEISCMVKNLTKLMRQNQYAEEEPGEWVSIAVRIAAVFGIFGELMRLGAVNEDNSIDMVTVSGDFVTPISLFYARKWGLPLGNIVCCCNENSNLWDFVCHGQLRTDGVAKTTCMPDADVVVPGSLERLIYAYGGTEEVERFISAVRSGRSYYLSDRLLQELREGIYITVNGEQRILSAISSMFSTYQYLMSPYDALSYVGLQDYRSRIGGNRCTILISEKSPLCDAEIVASAMGISVDDMRKIMENKV